MSQPRCSGPAGHVLPLLLGMSLLGAVGCATKDRHADVAATSALVSSNDAATSAQSQHDVLSLVRPYRWEGNIDKAGFAEPSGICYDPGRQTLFVVGDEGEVGQISTQGQWIRRRVLRVGADFEGITRDPATGLLYVAEEGAETIHELDPDTLKLTRSFVIDRHFEGQLLMAPEGNGLEAITFMPDAEHPEGGLFVVANQTFDLSDDRDISAMFEVELPLRSSAAAQDVGHIVRVLPLRIIDLSGLCYLPRFGRLLAISDAQNVLMLIDVRSGKVQRSWALPGDEQEGIALDSQGYLYIAQDTGGILKIKPHWPEGLTIELPGSQD